MRILFVTGAYGIDYQSDAVFNGLVSLGHDVTDSRYMWYHSSDIPDDVKCRLYGMGMSISGNLPDRSSICRTPSTIRSMILDRLYDVVVYGSIRRCSDFISDVTSVYGKEHVAIIDGEDSTDIVSQYLSAGVYFKRELLPDYSDIAVPISFAIPVSKYADATMKKVYDLSPCIPGRRDTYHCYREKTYYTEYGMSRFALTYKKTGWDCLRHYEIVAAGAVPLFTDMQHCPSTTMTTWPRELQYAANDMAYRWLNGTYRNDKEYSDLQRSFFEYGKSNMTTESLASYVLGRIG